MEQAQQGQAMTLREQCEAFEQRMHGAISRSPAQREDYVQWLERFARQQQAVGLRKAAEYWKQECGLFGPVVAWLEQQARELEGA